MGVKGQEEPSGWGLKELLLLVYRPPHIFKLMYLILHIFKLASNIFHMNFKTCEECDFWHLVNIYILK